LKTDTHQVMPELKCATLSLSQILASLATGRLQVCPELRISRLDAA